MNARPGARPPQAGDVVVPDPDTPHPGREPQRGDVAGLAPVSRVPVSDFPATVLAIHGDDMWILTRRGEPVTVPNWRDHGIVASPPRIKIHPDQWGWINPDGVYWGTGGNEKLARQDAESPHRTLARLVNGVVCDEHGVPFEIAEP